MCRIVVNSNTKKCNSKTMLTHVSLETHLFFNVHNIEQPFLKKLFLLYSCTTIFNSLRNHIKRKPSSKSFKNLMTIASFWKNVLIVSGSTSLGRLGNKISKVSGLVHSNESTCYFIRNSYNSINAITIQTYCFKHYYNESSSYVFDVSDAKKKVQLIFK